jgi:hypothetical protein
MSPRGGNHRGRGTPRKGLEMPPKRSVPRTCAHCGDAFMAYPHQVNAGGGLFCSRACYVAGGRRRTGDPVNTLSRACEWCGQAFSVPRSTLAHDPARYCSKPCYFAAWRAGAPERFWAKVDMNGPIVRPELGPCWLWTGVIASNGYGRVTDPGRGQTGAHQMAWRLAGGSLLTRKHVLHKCDVRACVNPAHLFLGSHADNMADMKAKGRRVYARQFTDDDIRRIRLLDASGTPQADLATEYGVTPSMISSIVRRVTYRHVA